MNAYRSRPLTYPWPSTFYILALGAAFGLQTFFPLQIMPSGRIWLLLAGGLLVILGPALIISALRALMHHHTSILSTRSTNHLVTSGPFRLTRNPVYLGYTLTILGVGLLTACPWTIAAAMMTAALIHVFVVRREEKHLLARFGFDFERYCRRTRAWI